MVVAVGADVVASVAVVVGVVGVVGVVVVEVVDVGVEESSVGLSSAS